MAAVDPVERLGRREEAGVVVADGGPQRDPPGDCSGLYGGRPRVVPEDDNFCQVLEPYTVRMIWEVWDAVSRNAIADFETEAEALAAVRSLVEDGWKVDDLLFMVDDPAWADEDVPLAITGDELARRAEISHRSIMLPNDLERNADGQRAREGA